MTTPPPVSDTWNERSEPVLIDSATILLVDDDPAMLETMADILEMWGFDPVPCSSPQRALEELAAARPDAVISDVIMPGMNGLQLTEKIRRSHPDLPVILISAYCSPKVRDQAREMGLHLLSKPLDPKTLIQWLYLEVGTPRKQRR